MGDSEFFSNVDIMISEKLIIKSLKDICTEFEKEVTENRGKYINDFKLSLSMGEKGENIVRKFLENKDYIFLSKCEDISHDYKFIKNGKEYIFEIKTDAGHIRNNKQTGELYETGNMAIEYESRGKPSGIKATKAEFFITYYPLLNELWLMKTAKLKELIKENEETIKKVEDAGDSNSNTKIYLLKRDKYKSKFSIANLY